MRVHVVAGVIYDHRRGVLIAQHNKADPYRGQWEFPGGKVESGEALDRALVRELHEELGLEVTSSRPLIEIHHDYPDLKVRLSVREVMEYTGEPVSREGQAVRWVLPAELSDINFLQANRTVVHAVQLPDAYIITDTKRFGVQATLSKLVHLLDGGIRLIQVREKHLGEDEFASFVEAVLDRCRPYRAVVLCNAAPNAVKDVGAHGVHLNSRRLSELVERPLDPSMWVSASCHNAEELDKAAAIGVDFAVLSPVNPSSSHPGAPALGWTRFKTLCGRTDFPIYALGGLTSADINRARCEGGQGVAMITGAWE